MLRVWECRPKQGKGKGEETREERARKEDRPGSCAQRFNRTIADSGGSTQESKRGMRGRSYINERYLSTLCIAAAISEVPVIELNRQRGDHKGRLK